MVYWQVQAEMLSGGRMLFGVQAEDRETAQVKVLLLLYGKGAAGVQLAGIPLPAERQRP